MEFILKIFGIVYLLIKKFDKSITTEKIDAELLNIEENNKNLPELEVIKLKREYLNKVDKILDAELLRIEKY